MSISILSQYTGEHNLNFQEMDKNHVVSPEVCSKLTSWAFHLNLKFTNLKAENLKLQEILATSRNKNCLKEDFIIMLDTHTFIAYAAF